MQRHPRLKCKGGINLHVIPNGLPVQEIEASSFANDFAPKGYDFDPAISNFCCEGLTVGSIGRLSPEKGYCYLIRALSLLVKNGIDAKLVIIGEGGERNNLEIMAKKMDLAERVLLPGYRKDAGRYLPLFDVFVISSLTEGLPITLLEAMRAGIPIIATAVGGIPEVLSHGSAGRLVQTADAQELAQAITQLCQDESARVQLANAAYQNFVSRFSVEKMTSKYLDIYQELTCS